MDQKNDKKAPRLSFLEKLRRERIAYSVTKLSGDVLAKLDQAFAIGATVEEACDYADVNPSTYYRWVKKYPELCEKFDRMRNKLPLKSKENIARAIHGEPIKGDIGLSKWLVERQQPGVYGETLKLQHSGSIDTDGAHPEDDQLRKELKERLKANIKKRWADKEKTKDENNQ